MPVSTSDKQLDDYREWALRELGWDFGAPERTYYERVTTSMRRQVVASNLWSAFRERYTGIGEKYYRLSGAHDLFQYSSPPEWEIKSFDSLVEKSFRMNKLYNPGFPGEPPGGWIGPENWYERVGDIVRARVVVRYLDGPKHLGATLREIAGELGQDLSLEFKCREDGYYAAHADIRYTLEIPRRGWDTRQLNCSCELQITTQLQELVQLLMHKYDAARRGREDISEDGMPWQWRFSDVEFSASYLGHVLHYLEGMIMDVRSKTGGQQ